jgi:hypothetical protein
MNLKNPVANPNNSIKKAKKTVRITLNQVNNYINFAPKLINSLHKTTLATQVTTSKDK